jgi:hypothetical protein
VQQARVDVEDEATLRVPSARWLIVRERMASRSGKGGQRALM